MQPCDVEFADELDRSCQEQSIANSLTLYSWEVSMERDSLSFERLQSSSILTSCEERELQTAYLQPNIFIRCLAQAVDGKGILGYSRTSHPVQLLDQQYNCYEGEGQKGGGAEGTISTYDGFTANDEVIRIM